MIPQYIILIQFHRRHDTHPYYFFTICCSSNVYIVDFGIIRKVNSAGYLSTFAGVSLFGSGGSTGDGIAATSATLSSPYGIAVDGNG